MNGGEQVQSYERVRPLEQWVRNRLRSEAMLQLAEGFFFIMLGLICVAFAILGYFFFVNAFFRTNTPTSPGIISFLSAGPRPNTFLVLAALIVIWFVAGYHYRSLFGYAGKSPKNQEYVEELGKAMLYSIVLSGPGLLLMGWENWEKCWHIWRGNVTQLADLLFWLYQRQRKTPIEEIMRRLPESEVVRTLPQLRCIPGVIWLENGHGTVILSTELRTNLASLFTRKRVRVNFYAPPPPPNFNSKKEPPKPPPPQPVNPEVIQWYLALNLPPFATLDQVKRRYRQLVKIHHPDANAGRRPGTHLNSEEQIRRINSAYHNILERSKK